MSAPSTPAAAPASVPAPVAPPAASPAPEAISHLPATPSATPAPRYGVPQPVERPAVPIMPPNPFARGAQTDRGLPPQLPVRHESAAIPVAFAQFSPEPASGSDESATADAPAEIVILRPSLAEALEAALADLPDDAPEKTPEPFPDVLTVAPPKAAMPGWS
ncbi:MAG: hypothetical protein ACTHK4_09640 [Mycobacteriales bacterium]